MLSTFPISNTNSERPNQFLFSVLENAEVGVVVVNASRRAIYMNASARNLLDAPTGVMPDWAQAHVDTLLRALDGADQQVQRWEHNDLVLRVRARPLDAHSELIALEVRVTRAMASGHVADQLARSLRLTISDGKLLALLWRGHSNDEIADILSVRVGTIKSRLFRLYQRLGVKRRPAAVLRAAEVLAA